MASTDGRAAGPHDADEHDTADEELLVIRLEDLGSFALPVALLLDHRLPAHDLGHERPTAAEAVPTILAQDFLRGTGRRDHLAIDRFGGVHTPDGQPPFGRST